MPRTNKSITPKGRAVFTLPIFKSDSDQLNHCLSMLLTLRQHFRWLHLEVQKIMGTDHGLSPSEYDKCLDKIIHAMEQIQRILKFADETTELLYPVIYPTSELSQLLSNCKVTND